MNFPCFIVSTIDCNCDDIQYKVVVCYDEHTNQEAIINAHTLLPFIGKTVDLLISHRLEENKKKVIPIESD